MATLGVKGVYVAADCGFLKYLFSFVSHMKKDPAQTLIIILITGHFEEEEIVVFGLGYFLKLLETHHKINKKVIVLSKKSYHTEINQSKGQ